MKFSNLVDEYWLHKGTNPDGEIEVVGNKINVENTLETVFEENLSEIQHEIENKEEQYHQQVQQQQQKQQNELQEEQQSTINPQINENITSEEQTELVVTLPGAGNELEENFVKIKEENKCNSEENTTSDIIISDVTCAVDRIVPSLNFDVSNIESSTTSNVETTTTSNLMVATVDPVQNNPETQAPLAEKSPQSNKVLQNNKPGGKKMNYMAVTCEICKKLLSSRNSLREHRITVHLKNGRFPCTLCDKRFTNRRTLQIHEVIHTKERKFVCESCGSTHKRARELKLHLQDMHNENQTHRCDVCFKCFKQKSHLKAHCFEEHVQTVTDCIVCKQKLMTPFSIYTHCLKHAGYREFECETCKRTYKTKKALFDHQKIHSQDRKPYNKCPKCGKAIYSRSHYYEHVNSHDVDSNEIVRFPCSICEATFQHKSSLKRHLLRHRPGGDLEHPKENPYLQMEESELPSLCCRKCRRLYTSKSGYYDHIKRCRDGIVGKFSCELCPKFYTKRSALNRHIRLHHSDVFEADLFDEQTTVEIVNSDQIETDENEVLVHVQVALAPDITDSQLTEHYIEENTEAIQSIEIVQTMPEA